MLERTLSRNDAAPPCAHSGTETEPGTETETETETETKTDRTNEDKPERVRHMCKFSQRRARRLEQLNGAPGQHPPQSSGSSLCRGSTWAAKVWGAT
eukprot:4038646-Alexandrium_andersonii.AAC.1